LRNFTFCVSALVKLFPKTLGESLTIKPTLNVYDSYLSPFINTSLITWTIALYNLCVVNLSNRNT